MLERSNKALQRFAYVASHDLTEPIRTIRIFNQLLGRDYNDALDSTGREYISYVVDATGRIQNLVSDLLLYARVLDQNAPRQIEKN